MDGEGTHQMAIFIDMMIRGLEGRGGEGRWWVEAKEFGEPSASLTFLPLFVFRFWIGIIST